MEGLFSTANLKSAAATNQTRSVVFCVDHHSGVQHKVLAELIPFFAQQGFNLFGYERFAKLPLKKTIENVEATIALALTKLKPLIQPYYSSQTLNSEKLKDVLINVISKYGEDYVMFTTTPGCRLSGSDQAVITQRRKEIADLKISGLTLEVIASIYVEIMADQIVSCINQLTVLKAVQAAKFTYEETDCEWGQTPEAIARRDKYAADKILEFSKTHNGVYYMGLLHAAGVQELLKRANPSIKIDFVYVRDPLMSVVMSRLMDRVLAPAQLKAYQLGLHIIDAPSGVVGVVALTRAAIASIKQKIFAVAADQKAADFTAKSATAAGAATAAAAAPTAAAAAANAVAADSKKEATKKWNWKPLSAEQKSKLDELGATYKKNPAKGDGVYLIEAKAERAEEVRKILNPTGAAIKKVPSATAAGATAFSTVLAAAPPPPAPNAGQAAVPPPTAATAGNAPKSTPS